MSVEQVARELILNMTDEAKVKPLLAPNAMSSGGVLPQPIPMSESIKMNRRVEHSISGSQIRN